MEGNIYIYISHVSIKYLIFNTYSRANTTNCGTLSSTFTFCINFTYFSLSFLLGAKNIYRLDIQNPLSFAPKRAVLRLNFFRVCFLIRGWSRSIQRVLIEFLICLNGTYREPSPKPVCMSLKCRLLWYAIQGRNCLWMSASGSKPSNGQQQSPCTARHSL